MTAKIFSWLRFPSQHLTKSRTISRRSTIKAQLHEMEMEKTECLQQGENLKTKERIGFIFVTWKQSLFYTDCEKKTSKGDDHIQCSSLHAGLFLKQQFTTTVASRCTEERSSYSTMLRGMSVL